MDIATILTSLISGGVGGNIVGSLIKKFNLGPLGNTIAGVIGGGVGGMVMNNMGATDMTTGVLENIAGSGIGGAIVMIVVGLIKNAMSAKKIGTTTSTTTTNTTANLNTVSKENPQPVNFKNNPPPKSRDYTDGPRP